MKRWTILSSSALAAALLAGCASTQPSQELVDARRTYHQAVASPAQRYVPAHVLSAQQALDRAEAAHADDPGSFEEASLAYIAQRRAQQAMTYGAYAQAQHDRALSEQAYDQTQQRLREKARADALRAQQSLAQTRTELSEIRRALATQDNKLSEQAQQLMAREKELAAREKELAASAGALEKEREARKSAELTAAAALKSLHDVAMVKEEARGIVITLSGEVLFASGKSELLPIARQRLQQVAEALKEVGNDKVIVIEGHTDSRGSHEANLSLSQRRAEAVLSFLADEKVDQTRMRAVGRGEHQPIADNGSVEGRANNRRVEIVIQDANRAPAR